MTLIKLFVGELDKQKKKEDWRSNIFEKLNKQILESFKTSSNLVKLELRSVNEYMGHLMNETVETWKIVIRCQLKNKMKFS